LHGVALTDGRTRRDLFPAALITIPIFLMLSLTIVAIMTMFKIISLVPFILLIIIILLTTFTLVYLQIREVVMVKDLLVGRDFKARSLIALLYKEEQIRKMSASFQTVLEQAETWHVPEVVDLTPEPPLRLLENENAVAG
jgi:hypothetical protein